MKLLNFNDLLAATKEQKTMDTIEVIAGFELEKTPSSKVTPINSNIEVDAKFNLESCSVEDDTYADIDPSGSLVINLLYLVFNDKKYNMEDCINYVTKSIPDINVNKTLLPF